MTTARRIVVFGDDGSAFADRAWLWINGQVWPGFEAHVVTCTRRRDDSASGDAPAFCESAGTRHTFAEAQLALVRTFTTACDAYSGLSAMAGELVVVGPRGRGGLAGMVLGSTVEHLLSSGGRPVVIVCGTAPVRSVLVCADGSAPAIDAARFVAGLPLFGRAESVTVLGVVDSTAPGAADAVRLGVDQTAAVLDRRDVVRSMVSTETTAASAILGVAADLGADLVVCGTRGWGGFTRMMIGSTTRSLARSGEVTLLAVPPKESDG